MLEWRTLEGICLPAINHTGTWHIQIKYQEDSDMPLEILSVDKLLDVYNLTMESTTISSTIWRTRTIRIFIIFQFDDSKVRLLVCGSSTTYDVCSCRSTIFKVQQLCLDESRKQRQRQNTSWTIQLYSWICRDKILHNSKGKNHWC